MKSKTRVTVNGINEKEFSTMKEAKMYGKKLIRQFITVPHNEPPFSINIQYVKL
jgi:hypothetical protein